MNKVECAQVGKEDTSPASSGCKTTEGQVGDGGGQKGKLGMGEVCKGPQVLPGGKHLTFSQMLQVMT